MGINTYACWRDAAWASGDVSTDAIIIDATAAPARAASPRTARILNMATPHVIGSEQAVLIGCRSSSSCRTSWHREVE